MEENEIGREMHVLAKQLFPICRSITGNGVRETLQILGEHIPLNIYEIPTGTEVFDWTIPEEWNIRDAYILDEDDNKIVDFKQNNLHVVGYSEPMDAVIPLAELQKHLWSLEDQPEAIPYVTSYYERRWGFCMAHNERVKLKEGNYRVFIDSELKEGHLTYAECILPGREEKEVFLSTYICHPSMANNELSGPVVTTFLTKWLANLPRKYTYRIIFVPETIGSIAYLSRHWVEMKKKIIAGFNISCVGDDRSYSYLSSRKGNTLADRVILNVLSFKDSVKKYTFLNRGSDERQYCSPNIDLPVASLMRSKYGDYPEYHTSLDDLENVVTPSGLQGAYDALKECIELIEQNAKYRVTCFGEPCLGKRNFSHTLSRTNITTEFLNIRNVLAFADGENDLIEISNLINVSAKTLYSTVDQLLEAGLLTKENI
jgi:aminopeptidase-like protein